MTTVIIHHDVTDYDLWRKVFDSAAEFRKAFGEQSAEILRDAGNPNQVTGIVRYDSLESAKAYFANPELKAKMAEAGVVGKPEIRFLFGS